MVQRRFARRQPGARDTHGSGRKTPPVQRAPENRVQGNRGWLSGGERHRVRLSEKARGRKPRSGRRVFAGAHAEPRTPHPQDVRVPQRREERDSPPLQQHFRIAAQGDVQNVESRNRRDRPHRRAPCALNGRRPRGRRHARAHGILPREFQRHRAGLRPRNMRGRQGNLEAYAGQQNHNQPARDRAVQLAQRLRRPD